MKLKSFAFIAALIPALGIVTAAQRPADDLDRFIESEMAKRQIVGLSLAIIDDGKIVDTRAYGTTTRGGSVRVTPNTLFQAGSISKPVSAIAALQLVEQGKLSLDEDVNVKLKSWKIPENTTTATERVTLRRLLSHTAGLTVHGFPGYAVTEKMPTVPDVLNGRGNTPAVFADVVPGSIWRYSGGGYTVMQQLLVDVTGQAFPDILRVRVLQPLGMTNSSYQQPPTKEFAARAATGYLSDRSEVAGRFHVYPEMAAAGLWTTPTDLAKWAIGVQQMVAGKSKVLSADMARQMLTEQKGSYGLGVTVAGKDSVLRFSHGGRDEGFDANVVAYANGGDGVAIMINANENSNAIGRITNFIARKYKWQGYAFPPEPEQVTAVTLPADLLNAVIGRYEASNNNMLPLVPFNGRLYSAIDGLPNEEFVLTADGRFVSLARRLSFKLVKNDAGEVTALDLTGPAGNTRRIPRIGPLFTTSTPKDPDPAFTAGLVTALREIAKGGEAMAQSKLHTEGARKDFSGGFQQLAGVTKATFAGAQDVRGRGIERHGHPVAFVLQYRVTLPTGEQKLLVFVTAEGLITDYDAVAN